MTPERIAELRIEARYAHRLLKGGAESRYNEMLDEIERLQAFENHPLIPFLLGESGFDGLWFGDWKPGERGQYWWRKQLRAALEAAKAGA